MEAVLSVQATRRRAIALAGLAFAALLVHWLAFSGVSWVWPAEMVVPSARAVEVRTIDSFVSAPVAVGAVEHALAPAHSRVRERERERVRVRASEKGAARLATDSPGVAPAVAVVASPVASPAPLSHAFAPVVLAPPAAAAPVDPDEFDAIPSYRVLIPPPVVLHYQLLRGTLHGEGEIAWRPAADGYELRLEARVAGIPVLTQISSGGLDAVGIAPLRFTDQRPRRATMAANFQREARKITFSGPSTEYPLRAGTQDRLSWMLQLAAILEAEATLREPGAKVVIPVVGANGDLSVWAFVSGGIESLTLAGNSVDALKFVREPRGPYDTQIQVWLDPARHHLPVRATQKSGPNDEGFELRLQSVE